MKKDELETLLKTHQSTATGAVSGYLGGERAKLASRYMGELYGDEVEGRSKIVMTDIRDTIEGIKPELMDIFFGGDKVVMFSPRGDEDVDAAEQETEVCNYIVMQQNNGFMLFYEWFHDALVYKNGYIKRYWDEREHSRIEQYDDLTPDEVATLLMDLEQDDIEYDVVEQWTDGGESDDGDEAQEPTSMGIKLKITEKKQRYVLESVPPEEIYVSPLWTKVHFDGCPFVAHRSVKTVSDLIEMGFDRKQVESLPVYDRKLGAQETIQRFNDLGFEDSFGAVNDDAMREVLIFENYVRADYNGDGVAELLQVYTGEYGEILKRDGKDAIEEVDGVPFNALTPLPVPHKHIGLSVSELVSDLQRLRTVLSRQLIDNIVMSNNPDRIIDEDAATDQTYQDLAVTQPGRNIRIPGGPNSIRYEQPPQTAQQSLLGIEYVDSLREARTGVTRYNQGLDANSLNKTATGVKQIMSAAQKKILLIARIFAETGVKQMFIDMHRDLRKGPMKKIAIRLRNEWVEVDPREWSQRDDMTISVGLGTGDRDLQFQRLSLILAQQKEALTVGMVTPKNIHNTLAKMVELSGFKDVSRFFPDPDTIQQPPKQQQPDPSVMLAQVEMKKNEMAHQAKMAEIELKKMELQIKAEAEQTKRLDVMLKDDRERDIAGAQIEGDEAARTGAEIDGLALTHDTEYG